MAATGDKFISDRISVSEWTCSGLIATAPLCPNACPSDTGPRCQRFNDPNRLYRIHSKQRRAHLMDKQFLDDSMPDAENIAHLCRHGILPAKKLWVQ